MTTYAHPIVRVGSDDYGYTIGVTMGADMSTMTEIRAQFRSPTGAVVTIDITPPTSSTIVAPVLVPEASKLTEVGTWNMTVAGRNASVDVSSGLVKVVVEPRSVSGDFWA